MLGRPVEMHLVKDICSGEASTADRNRARCGAYLNCEERKSINKIVLTQSENFIMIYLVMFDVFIARKLRAR